MADLVKKIRTDKGDLQIDYNALANLPDAANKVKNPLVIQLNGGSTEGTDVFTFDGSSAKNINVTPVSMYGITDGGIASVKENSRSSGRYVKIADVQCSGYYHRICQSILLTSRVEAIILTIVIYSDESDKFTGYSASYMPLTATWSGITDHLHAGLVNVSSTSNKFELWYHQGQWGQSLNITPLARNEEGRVLNFYSYNATSAGSASAPQFTTAITLQNLRG